MPVKMSSTEKLFISGEGCVNTAIIGRKYLCREALMAVLQNSGLNFFHQSEDASLLLANIAGSEQPDLLICCIDQYGNHELFLQQIGFLRLTISHMKTILLTDIPVDAAVVQAVHSGIEACLSNDISGQVLQRAVELVLSGQHLFAANIARHLVEPPASGPERLPPAPVTPSIPVPEALTLPLTLSGAAPLSKREFQILRHLVDGLPNKTIARALDITEATVKVHIKALLRKTRMANRTQVAIWAVNNGFALAAEAQDTAFQSSMPQVLVAE